MSRFGAVAQTLADLGVRLFGASSDSPFAHQAFAERLGLTYPLLSDYSHEAAAAFGILAERGADLHELLAAYRPINTRGAFLVDRDGVLRYGWVPDTPLVIPDPGPLVEAARTLAAPQ